MAGKKEVLKRLISGLALGGSLFVVSYCWFAFYSQANYLLALIFAACYGLVVLVGITCSEKFLVAFFLSFPTLFTYRGRVVLIGVALSLLSREVIANIQLNTHEIARASDCVQQFGQHASAAASDQIVSNVRGIVSDWLELGEEFRRNFRLHSAKQDLFALAKQDASINSGLYATALSGFIGDAKFGAQPRVVDFRLERSSSEAVNDSVILESPVVQLDGVMNALQTASSCFIYLSLLTGCVLFYFSWRYQQRYLTSNSFNNIYVEQQSLIDNLRGTKYARYAVITSSRLARIELIILKTALPIFLVDCIVAAILLLYNAAISQILKNVSEAATTEFPTVGTIDVGWDVQSSVKLSRTSYSVHHPYNMSVTLGSCSLVTHHIDLIIYYKVFVLFGLMLVGLCLHGYVQRLQHMLLDSFFPRRKTERKNWLLKKLLFQRSSAVSQESSDDSLSSDKRKSHCSLSLGCFCFCCSKREASSNENLYLSQPQHGTQLEAIQLKETASDSDDTMKSGVTDATDTIHEVHGRLRMESEPEEVDYIIRSEAQPQEIRRKANTDVKRKRSADNNATVGWSWVRRLAAALLSSSLLAGATIAYFVLVCEWSIVSGALVAFFVFVVVLISCGASYRFMSVAVAMFPSLLASQGRCILLALAITLVATGAGYNTLVNMNSVVQSTSCAAHANYKYTQQVREQTAKQAELAIQKWAGVVKKTNDYVDTEFVEYVKHVEKRKSWSQQFIGQLGSGLCTALIPALCPPPKGKSFTLNIKFQKINFTETGDSKLARQQLFAELERDSEQFENATVTTKRSVSVLVSLLELLTFLAAFFASYLYIRKWLSSVKFDNVYVTKEVVNRCDQIFQDPITNLDGNVHENMPKAEYIHISSWKLSRIEFQQMVSGTVKTLFVAVVAASVLLFDVLVALLLDTLTECYQSVPFSTSATLYLDYEIVGLGKLSHYQVRKTIAVDKFILPSENALNKCTRSASYVAKSTYISIVCLFCVAALTLLTMSYMQRLRIVLLNSLYPRHCLSRKKWLIESICDVQLRETDSTRVSSSPIL